MKKSKYKVSYFYMATGMDSPDEYNYTIRAESELKAVYKAHRRYGFWRDSTFEEFKDAPKWKQYWGTSVKKV